MNIKKEDSHIHTIRLSNYNELQLNMIIDWLSDLPFRGQKKISKTEAIKICIHNFYKNCFEEQVQ